MRIGLEEALDILRKWHSEKSLVSCNLDCSRFATAFRGRVREVLPDLVRVWSDDTTAALALAITPDLEFAHGHPRALSEEAATSTPGLLVFFPPAGPGREPERDAIVFTELVDSEFD